MVSSEVFEFGPFRLEPAEQRLTRNGVEVHLTPRSLALLTLLVREGGRLVSKERALREVWSDAVVEEGSLTRQISTLRALLDGDEAGRWIETVPKRGYRFVGTVSRAETSPVAPAVAVLPFAYLGGEPDEPYFGVGLADALAARLGRARDLVVRPTSAVLRFSGADVDAATAGRQLRVGWVAEGRIRRAGDRLRVNAQLVRVADGRAIWSEVFDHDTRDVFALEDAIAERVAAAIVARLSSAQRQQLAHRPTEHLEAHLFYLRANYHLYRFSPADLVAAYRAFQQAIALDPQFAAAWAGLASTYAIGETTGQTFGAEGRDEAVTQATLAARRAVELDPELAEGHRAVAEVTFWYQHDAVASDRSFQRALELGPHHALVHHYYGWFLVATGRFAESHTHLRRALELDPTSVAVNVDQGLPCYFSRRYREALACYQAALELDVHSPYTHLRLAEAHEALGDLAAAVREIDAAAAVLGPAAWPHRARALALAGRAGEARDQLRKLGELPLPSSAYLTALALVALGDRDAALAQLELARAERDKWLAWATVDPRLDPVRSEPRVQRLLAQLRRAEVNASG